MLHSMSVGMSIKYKIIINKDINTMTVKDKYNNNLPKKYINEKNYESISKNENLQLNN